MRFFFSRRRQILWNSRLWRPQDFGDPNTPKNLSRWKNYTNKGQIPDVMNITVGSPKMPFTGPRAQADKINFRCQTNSLKGKRRPDLPRGIDRVKGFLGAVPQIVRNWQAPTG